MGFLSRVRGLRGRRRRRTSSLRTALEQIAGSLTRNKRGVDGKKIVAVYRHGTCTVNHRTREAASRCRRTS
jgi:hypothetical protein